MELIFNPNSEFLWCPEGPVSQIHSSPRWCPWDIFWLFKVSSDAKERVGCGKQREATAPIKSLVKLLPWFLSLRWKTCLRQNCSLGSCTCSEGPVLGQNTDDDDDDDISKGIFLSYCRANGGEGWLGFPDLWSGQKPWWNWYLTPVMNFSDVRRAQLAKFTLLISTMVPMGYFQILFVCENVHIDWTTVCAAHWSVELTLTSR